MSRPSWQTLWIISLKLLHQGNIKMMWHTNGSVSESMAATIMSKCCIDSGSKLLNDCIALSGHLVRRDLETALHYCLRASEMGQNMQNEFPTVPERRISELRVGENGLRISFFDPEICHFSWTTPADFSSLSLQCSSCKLHRYSKVAYSLKFVENITPNA